jgi:hypothetical protein
MLGGKFEKCARMETRLINWQRYDERTDNSCTHDI